MTVCLYIFLKSDENVSMNDEIQEKYWLLKSIWGKQGKISYLMSILNIHFQNFSDSPKQIYSGHV